jgi:hypothetical protein
VNAVIARLLLRVLPAPGGIRPRLANRFEGGSVVPDAGMAPDAPLAATVASSPDANRHAPSLRHATRVAEVGAPPPGTAHARPATREVVARASEAPQPLMPRAVDVPLRDHSFCAPTSRTQLPPAHPEAPPRSSAQAPAAAQRLPLLPPATAPADFALTALPTLPSNPSARQPPDVEISIGRIEVRTPRTRKIEHAPRARPKLMSLEDYLSKGRRTR